MKKKNKELFFSLLLLIVTISIILFIGEAFARIFYKDMADYNTEMWRYASEVKMKSDDPLVSHVHIPNKEADLYGVHVKINSKGLRDYEYDYNKKGDVFRILVIGDSVTFGWGTEFEDIYSKRLEKKLNEGLRKYEVINTGVGNYNSVMEAIFLRNEGLKYDPDMIIVGYYINDAEVTPHVRFYNIKRLFYLYGVLWSKYINALAHLKKDFNYVDYYGALYEDSFEGKANAEKSLKEIIDLAHKNNIPLLFVVFPEFHEFNDYQFSTVTAFVQNIAKGERVYFLDLLPYYIETSPKDVWVSYEDVHPNALGHKIAADAIYGKLEEILPKT